MCSFQWLLSGEIQTFVQCGPCPHGKCWRDSPYPRAAVSSSFIIPATRLILHPVPLSDSLSSNKNISGVLWLLFYFSYCKPYPKHPWCLSGIRDSLLLNLLLLNPYNNQYNQSVILYFAGREILAYKSQHILSYTKPSYCFLLLLAQNSNNIRLSKIIYTLAPPVPPTVFSVPICSSHTEFLSVI